MNSISMWTGEHWQQSETEPAIICHKEISGTENGRGPEQNTHLVPTEICLFEYKKGESDDVVEPELPAS